jgi:hypothetical protein
MARKENLLAKPNARQIAIERTGESSVDAIIEEKLHTKRSGRAPILLPKLPLEPLSGSTTDAVSRTRFFQQLAKNSANSDINTELTNSIAASLGRIEGYRLRRTEDEQRERDQRLRAYREAFRQDAWRIYCYPPEAQSINKKMIALIDDALAMAIQEQLSRSDTAAIESVEILRLIQRQPMTMQNIADSFKVSIEDVYPLVGKLLSRGFIDKLDGNFLRKLFPFIGANRRRVTIMTDPNTHFTLTLKGYFKLNPVITINN